MIKVRAASITNDAARPRRPGARICTEKNHQDSFSLPGSRLALTGTAKLTLTNEEQGLRSQVALPTYMVNSDSIVKASS